MLQTFTFNGAGRQINAQAEYFRYESGSAGGADESIRVRADGQDLGEYMPGDAIRLHFQAVAWEITPVNPACVGKVRLGVGDVSSARLVGSVRVIDSAAEKTTALAQFFQGVGSNAQAALCSWVWIRAIVGRVAVKRIQLQSAVAGQISWGSGDSSGTMFTGSSKYALSNKFIGRAGSTVAQVGGNAAGTGGTTAGYPPTAGESPVWVPRGSVYVPANTPTEMPLTTPLILENGALLGFCSTAVNRDVAMTVDCEEL